MAYTRCIGYYTAGGWRMQQIVKIHYKRPFLSENFTACGIYRWRWKGDASDRLPVTIDRKKVTCKRCRKTYAYKKGLSR